MTSGTLSVLSVLPTGPPSVVVLVWHSQAMSLLLEFGQTHSSASTLLAASLQKEWRSSRLLSSIVASRKTQMFQHKSLVQKRLSLVNYNSN